MSDAMRDQLEQAYNLIQNDRLDDAVCLLRPIVRAEPNNPDAWWLLANAVSDPNDAFEALNNVLRLEPTHEQARELLDNLLQEYPELAARTPRPTGASTTSSGVRSTSNIAPAPTTNASFDTNWDTQFGEPTEAKPVTPSTEIDDFFSTLDPSATVSDFDTAVGSFETNFADDSFGQTPANKQRATTEADLDSLFSTDDDASDMDALFAKGRAEAETLDDVNADTDLDTMFAASASSAAERVGSEDPFGSTEPDEPDFLQDLDTTTTADSAEQGRARNNTTSKVSTRTSGVIPAQDPFAAEKRVNQGGRSRNLILGLIVVAVLAVILIAVALLRPFSTPPTDNATATTEANVGIGQIGLADAVSQVLTSANFTNPQATIADNKLSVQVCEKPGRNLRTRFYDAIKAVANTSVAIGKQVTNAEITLVDCSQSNARLYRATAPISALVDYSADHDETKYRAAWVPN